ncbi:MAG: pyruvate kinase [Candidatus Pacebacteria bacterium]|nr:pyruvate kinase [Candidatus Paceibacterota bacterium]
MNYLKKTKIIATLGPASDKEKIIKELILEGVNVFRFNLKHNNVFWHNQRIKRVQKIANILKTNVGILIDLQGPEIRIDTKNKQIISVKKGDEIIIGSSFSFEKTQIAILNKAVFDVLKKGDNLLIDDGFIEMKIIKKEKELIIAKVIQGGKIKNKKGLNIPGKKINLSSLIEQDIKRLDMIAKSKVDFIALSFARSKKDIDILKKEIEKRKINAQIVAKIECQEALDNIDELISVSDAIMIARGDLGIEVPIEQLAFWQKNIIKKCRLNRKPVIVATQMLHSMINNPRPTRAEAIDVAGAVFDKTDAVMLSEETAAGNFPLRAVQAMSKILLFNEEKTSFEDFQLKPYNVVELIASSVFSLVEKQSLLNIKKVIVFTESGYTANVMASFRSKAEIIAITNNQKTAEILSLSFGIQPVFTPLGFSENKIFDFLKKENLIKENEIIALVHGKQKKRPKIFNSFSLTKV